MNKSLKQPRLMRTNCEQIKINIYQNTLTDEISRYRGKVPIFGIALESFHFTDKLKVIHTKPQ